jgi:hypothetical protein
MRYMKVYRHAVDNDGGSSFYKTKTEALAAYNKTEKAGLKSNVEQLEVPCYAEGFVMALNLALCHPDHWHGERIMPKPTNK